MGASRKLQGEIDRVLKKVQEGVEVFDSIWNKVYDTDNANQKEKFEADLKKEIKKLQRYRDQIKTWIQSSEIKDKKDLIDARKIIEREMERFKICEKETKTKAFSKEGLGQQPKTDPKEKAKSETRDWLNNVVGDLESQIDYFEAEVEGFSVKKGKSRPPRLTHLEASIARHKAHILKLEMILRLLDNDELTPDEVNDVKEFLEDYVERNQVDFDQFNDVDELYSSLPLEKVEALEDLVSLGPSSLVKVALSSTASQSTTQDQSEEASSQDTNADPVPRTPPSKSGALGSSVSVTSPRIGSGTIAGPNASVTANASPRSSVGSSAVAAVGSSSVSSSSSSVRDVDNMAPSHRPSPAIRETRKGSGVTQEISSQTSLSASVSLGAASGPSGNGALGSVPLTANLPKRNVLGADERMRSSDVPQMSGSALSDRVLLQHASRSNDGTCSSNSNSLGDGGVIGGRVSSPSVGSGVHWGPQSAPSLQNQNETGQFRGRPEIAPDQREKFLQRLQQVQLPSQNSLPSMSQFSSVTQKQLPMQQQNSLLQQISSISPQPTPVLQEIFHHTSLSTGPKVGDAGRTKIQEQQQHSLSDDLNAEPATHSGLNRTTTEDELKASSLSTGSSSMAEVNQFPRDLDVSPRQILQPSQQSTSLGVIGRRSVPDLGTIGDNVSASVRNSGATHDLIHNYQMLQAAYYKLPQPRDSERLKNYAPRNPAVTPTSFPQAQAPIVANPAFWERFSIDSLNPDLLFFAFYYQQNTYQQYLAARELKRQSWRYHKKFNTWFQRHEEPEVTTDEYERGSYMIFDIHAGWCQKITNDFTFEYNFLEDELAV
ncbi:CCR4-NOT transcription complex subunit 3-like isoform X2 [Ananas comosus]|uniref:CCR4-NOT transcription complex subunit 3-like isoform X2 n=1 Tax=Ananas comosus TaxID=4615 RepID=A0A6P5FRF5_ANACO|nr:CCR4-NOT transcription complex subunit 3-like isoform X2 [Ananas comosus]